MNLVYNASAGTGKTYQVTELYERLVLEEGIDPRRILLMTFTDNAATELRMRVSQRLARARREAEAADDRAHAETIRRALSQLSGAPIETIHAYCTRLLREHAIEAGLSPGFTTLVGDERAELLDQICRDELMTHLASDHDFRDFCSGAQIMSFGKGFGTSITETVLALIGEAGSLGIELDAVEAMLPEPEPPVSRVVFEQIRKRLQQLPRITSTAQTALDILGQCLEATTDVESLVEMLNERGLSKFGRGEAKPVSDDLWELKTAVEDAMRYRHHFPAARAFARYVESVYRRFAQRKHAMDAVDFDDQLRLAARLLKEGSARPGFDYIIVDEVQDTSRIQYDIIRKLWCDGSSLVICGDRKQSIYTWRGADPQVMPDLEREILTAGGRPENLQTSYRSASPILGIINRLFERVYGADTYTETEQLRPNPAFVTEGEKASVEFLSEDTDGEPSRAERVAAEMEAVANRIRLLVEGGPDWRPLYRYHDGRFRPVDERNRYRYADVLILLHRTTHQSALEQSLRHAGIPYTLGGKGRGLFARQETRDVSLFLNVITNPSDLCSLIGFLRSPWIGLSDEEIAELAWSDGGFSVDHLAAHYAMTAGPSAALIHRYRELLATKLASELVRMLIEETGYDALLAGLPRGGQRLANLRKILDWLRDAERGARMTPAAVARRLARLIADPPNVPEAALLDPAQNAVTIMTVHGAKGLTSRVVAIPDLSFSPDSDRGFARLLPAGEARPMLGLKITAPDRSTVESPAYKKAGARAKQLREHERRNLLYVAMTRARNLVITSATVGARPDGWYRELEPFIGSDISAVPYSELKRAVPAPPPRACRVPTDETLTARLRACPPPPDPPRLRRIAATRLAAEPDRMEPGSTPTTATPSDHAAALGSLGHAVLEQLALNGWAGSAETWLDRLRDDFGIAADDAAKLTGRIEAARQLMQQETAGAFSCRPEFPFVLHDGEHLIDGTIDLLCRGNAALTLYDYKFTDNDDRSLLEAYRGQMQLYAQAVRRLHPDDTGPDCILVVISAAGTRLLPVSI